MVTCWPVTPEIAGSIPVCPAKSVVKDRVTSVYNWFDSNYSYQNQGIIKLSLNFSDYFKIKNGGYYAKSRIVHSKCGLTRIEKRRKRYSNNFNEIFTFFLQSYRVGILDFCGSEVITRYDRNGQESKFCFKSFDNGVYSKDEIYTGIKTRHPNVLRGVIIGKKSWGLWKNEWSEGISQGLFSVNEILEEFKQHNIEIPDSLKKDFLNTIIRMCSMGDQLSRQSA